MGSANLLKKVYFPRLVIPISAVLGGLVDFAISLAVLVGMMAYYRIWPSVTIIFLPLLLLLAVASALGVGIWLAALNVEYRDVRYVVPFLTLFWQYATPVAYSSSLIPAQWRLLYGLNPMTGVVEGFRWALLGKGDVGGLLWVSIIIILVLIVTGLAYFKRMEATFADVI